MRTAHVALVAVPVLALLMILAPPASSASNPFMKLHWTVFAANPVLTPGNGTWDDLHVVGGPVLLVNGVYRTWYVGSSDNVAWSTGTATSPDGIHWTKDPSNPILPYDGGSQVLYENGTYRMWYSYMNTNAYGVPWQVRYATSADGVHWTAVVDYSVLNVTAGAWDSATLSPGPVIHDGNGYRMWYSATDDGMVWRAGLATSSDGLHWAKYAGNPIIVPPFAGSWDNLRVHPSYILKTANQLVLWYVSDDTNLVQRIGVAVSTDGVHWTPSPNPVLDVGAPGTWDSGSLSRLSIVQLKGILTMWFTGRNGSSGFDGTWQVGMARAELNGQGEDSLAAPSASTGLVVLGAGGAIATGAGVFVAAAVIRKRPRP